MSITGFVFKCLHCEHHPILWVPGQIGIQKDGTIIFNGLCLSCGTWDDCGLTPEQQVEAMLESDDGEDEGKEEDDELAGA